MAETNGSPSNKNRITARQAAEQAVKYLLDLSPSVMQLTIEETELNEEDNCWRITLSFYDGLPVGAKKLKLFKVDASSGDVRFMRIRGS